MPLAERPEETKQWRTIGGVHVQVKEGQDPLEALREKMPSKGGEKAKNTKESREMGKFYEQRFSIFKGVLEKREQVVFDKYEKEVIIAGWDGFNHLILHKGEIIPVHPDYVFRTSELTKYGHWDAMTKESRIQLLKELNLETEFYLKDYIQLPDAVRELFKGTSPAGYGNDAGGFGTGVQGKVNPVSNEISVSERIRNEISRRAQEKEAEPPKILDESQEAKFEENEAEQGHQEAEGTFNPVYDDPESQGKATGEGKLVEGGEPLAPEELPEKKEEPDAEHPKFAEEPKKEKEMKHEEEIPKEKKDEE